MKVSPKRGVFWVAGGAAFEVNLNFRVPHPFTSFVERACFSISNRAENNLIPRPIETAATKNAESFLKPLHVTLRSMNVTESSANSNGLAVHADHVSRHYKMGVAVIRAVDEVSLDVRAGEFLALLGASGSGKSTLLNLIAGLDRPSSGAIFAQGRDLATMSSEELASHRNKTIGIVFQSFQLLPRMTLEENVELPLRLAEVPRGERQGRVRESLDRVGLAGRVKHRPTELSGGEQQRAAIARALVNRPMILLADEPTGNLDSKTGEEIMNLLAEIHGPASGPRKTIIMVTHERALAEQYADRIVTLSDGAISQQEQLR
jgi:putative ABC transport system ATP-binding protein